MIRLLSSVLLLGVMLIGVAPAHATLIEDTVSLTATDTDNASSIYGPNAMAVVGGGVEYTGGTDTNGAAYNVDLGASSITITLMNGIGPNNATFSFSSLNWTDFPGGFIDGVTLASTTQQFWTSLAANPTFGNNSVSINLRGFNGNAVGSTATWNLSVTHVPEPSTLAMLGVVAMVGGGWHFRRRRLKAGLAA